MKSAVDSLLLLALAMPLAACADMPPPTAGAVPPQSMATQDVGRTGPAAGGYSQAPLTDPSVLAAADIAVQGETYYLQHQPGGEATQLTLVSIANAEQQVVAGMNYRLQLKVKHNGRERLAEAVLFKPLSANPMTLTSWTWK